VRVDEEDTVGGSEEDPLLPLSQVVSREASGRVSRPGFWRGTRGVSWTDWALVNGMALISAVHAEVVPAAMILLFLAESLEGATGNRPLRRVGPEVGGGGWGNISTRMWSWCWSGWPGRVAAFQASLVETGVDAYGQGDKGAQLCLSLHSGELVLDGALETVVKLADERLFAPRQQSRMTAELRSIGGDRAGLSELAETASGGTDDIRVTKGFGNLCGKEGEVVHPCRRVVHVEVRLDPRERRASKEGARILDLRLAVQELGRLEVKDKADLRKEVAQVGSAYAVEILGGIDLGLWRSSERLGRGRHRIDTSQ
jgi:hypothetical protein